MAGAQPGRLALPSDDRAPSGSGLDELTAVESLPILLVDDRPENLQALEAVLAPLGLPLRTASSGAEALRKVLAEDFALILLDVRMPHLDGLEAARMIKSRERSRHVPIVFLTAAQDELKSIVQGYEAGAVDYLVKPFDPELLRSKVLVLAELEASRRALKRSEAFLRGAFEAAPIGKTLLDDSRSVMRVNPAFARLLGRSAVSLEGVPVDQLVDKDDARTLHEALDQVTGGEQPATIEPGSVDLRLIAEHGPVEVSIVASSIEPREELQPMLLIQWVDLTARRRAEQARAELLLEQAARTQAEATAERLTKLQNLTDRLESAAFEDLLPELALRLARLFEAAVVEVEIDGEGRDPAVVRVAGNQVLEEDSVGGSVARAAEWQEVPLRIEQATMGKLRLALPAEKRFGEAERGLLTEAADRAALSIRRAQLHEEEHRIAVELQRGLLPKALPIVDGVQLAAHYQAAGLGAEVGGDWYDAFPLADGRIGIVVGDVAGMGIRAASTMGQLRSLVRGFALGDGGRRSPGEVLDRLNRHQLADAAEEVFTIAYAVVDPVARVAQWASAGHPPPLLVEAGQGRFLEGAGSLMGIEDASYETLAASFKPPATLLFYTDGLVERRGESLDAGLRRLKQAAESSGAGGFGEPEELCRHVLRELVPGDEALHDDVTALVARVAEV